MTAIVPEAVVGATVGDTLPLSGEAIPSLDLGAEQGRLEGVETAGGRALREHAEEDQVGMVGKELSVGPTEQASKSSDPGIDLAPADRNQAKTLTRHRAEDPRREHLGAAPVEVSLLLADRRMFEEAAQLRKQAPPGLLGHRPVAKGRRHGSGDRLEGAFATRERTRRSGRRHLLHVDRERASATGGEEVAATPLGPEDLEPDLATQLEQSQPEGRLDEANRRPLPPSPNAPDAVLIGGEPPIGGSFDRREQDLDRRRPCPVASEALADPLDQRPPPSRWDAGLVGRLGRTPSHRRDATPPRIAPVASVPEPASPPPTEPSTSAVRTTGRGTPATPTPRRIGVGETFRVGRCTAVPKGRRRENMVLRMGEMLVAEGVLSEEQVEEVLAIQREIGEPFGSICERIHGVSPETIEGVWARQYEHLTRELTLDEVEFDPAVAELVSPRQAWQFRVLPIAFDGGSLVLATTRHSLARALRFATRVLRHPAMFLLLEPAALATELQRRHPFGGLNASALEGGVHRPGGGRLRIRR